MASSLIFAGSGRVGSGLTMRAAGRVGPVHMRAFSSFCSFSKVFSCNLWLFGVNLLPSKINTFYNKKSCKICGKMFFSCGAFGFGPGSMPSLLEIDTTSITHDLEESELYIFGNPHLIERILDMKREKRAKKSQTPD